MTRMRDQRRRHAPIATLVLALLLVSGCASRSAGSQSGRFIKRGEPAMDYGRSRTASGTSLQEHMRKVRHLSARATPRATTLGGTVEATDPRLAAALLMEAMLPTADSHLQVAEEYRRLGILDSAHSRLNRALQQNPRLAPAHEAMARVWRDWGLPELGLASAYRATYYDAASASAHNTLGTVLDALGETEGARSAYAQAVALDPRAAWALNNLCYLEFRQGRFDAAQGHCEAALQFAPSLVAGHNNLALTYAATGDLVRAHQQFRAAGDDAAAEYNMGIVHLAQGQHAPAAYAFEEAIKARPAFAAAKARAHAARWLMITGRE